jgi:hypothetical protein
MRMFVVADSIKNVPREIFCIMMFSIRNLLYYRFQLPDAGTETV